MTGPIVYIYGDYACPHTYVMDARLQILSSEGACTTVWRPLPTHGQGGGEDWRSLGGEASDLEETVEDLARSTAGLGLPFRLPARPPETRLALLASEFARDCGSSDFQRFHRAVFRSVFSDASDIGDPEVLEAIADRAGIDLIGLRAALEDGRYERTLTETEAEAATYGISATPTVLIGPYKVVGAAPLDILRNTIARAADG